MKEAQVDRAQTSLHLSYTQRGPGYETLALPGELLAAKSIDPMERRKNKFYTGKAPPAKERQAGRQANARNSVVSKNSLIGGGSGACGGGGGGGGARAGGQGGGGGGGGVGRKGMATRGTFKGGGIHFTLENNNAPTHHTHNGHHGHHPDFNQYIVDRHTGGGNWSEEGLEGVPAETDPELAGDPLTVITALKKELHGAADPNDVALQVY